MGYTLQDHFNKLAEQNFAYRQIKATFDYNRPLIKGALSKVDAYFETYSMHDESHSEKILANIERFLGKKRIECLSITDTYLILCAAYLHDFGMIITHKKAQEICSSNGFKCHIVKLEKDPKNDKLVQFFRFPEKMKNCEDWPVEAISAFKSIICDYVRAKHSLHSKDEILDNFTQYDINLNPNNIYPERVITVLAEICRLHGANFDEIKNLEKCSNGLFDDYMYPRYIATLIRIGDLLDLDNNRFNADQLRMIKELGTNSQVHYDKHKAVTAFYVSEKRIHITAESNNSEVLHALREWNGYLIDELENFRKNLWDFVPNDWEGTVPDYDILVKRKNSEEQYRNVDLKLNFPPKKAFDIIIGNDIYNDSLSFIREYLQNAIDSSKLLFWKRLKEIYPPETLNESMLKRLENAGNMYEYAIHLKVYDCRLSQDFLNLQSEYVDSNSNIEAFKNKIVFVFQDHGIGISNSIFQERILKVGKRIETDTFSKMIDTMPEIIKPTSSFGIGIHSAFLVADSIIFQTKYAYEESDGRLITIQSGTNGGYVTCDKVVAKSDTAHIKIGTNAYIAVDPHKIHIDEKIIRNTFKPYFTNQADSCEELVQNESIMIKKFIYDYCVCKVHSDIFPVYVDGAKITRTNKSHSKETITIDNVHFRLEKDDSNETIYSFTDLKTGHSVDLEMYPDRLWSPTVQSFFKEMIIDDPILKERLLLMLVPGVNAKVNFRFKNASEYLKIDRETIVKEKLDEYLEVFRELVSRAILLIADHKKKELDSNEIDNANLKIYGKYGDKLEEEVAPILQKFFDETGKYVYEKTGSFPQNIEESLIPTESFKLLPSEITADETKIFLRAFVLIVSESVLCWFDSKNISRYDGREYGDYENFFYKFIAKLLDKLFSASQSSLYEEQKNEDNFIKKLFNEYTSCIGAYFYDFLNPLRFRLDNIFGRSSLRRKIYYQKEIFPSVQLILLHRKYGQNIMQSDDYRTYIDFLKNASIEYMEIEHPNYFGLLNNKRVRFGRTLIKHIHEVYLSEDIIYKELEKPQYYELDTKENLVKCIYPIEYIFFGKQGDRKEFWYAQIKVSSGDKLINTNNLDALLSDFILSEISVYKYEDENQVLPTANYYLDNYCIPGVEGFEDIAVKDLPIAHQISYSKSKFQYIRQGFYMILPINKDVMEIIISDAMHKYTDESPSVDEIKAAFVNEFSCDTLATWTHNKNGKPIDDIKKAYKELFKKIVDITFEKFNFDQ